MFDLKVINSVLAELEEERGIPKERMIDAIEQSLATAYKKEFGKRGQIITADFDLNTGDVTFNQVKIVVDESMLKPEASEDEEEVEAEVEETESEEDTRVRFDEEKHIMINTARMIKKDVELGEELVFPLESKDEFGRIAAQTAKQVIVQKMREAEKEAAFAEFGQKAGDIVVGQVQRFERGNLYVDLGRVTALMPYEEQIPKERFKPGERIRAILLAVEETPRGIFLKLSRSHPDFLTGLFTIEAPELQTGAVEVKAVAREAGSRSKIAVYAQDQHIDPVGSMVGQRGVRVSTVMSELGGEKIDIIEWSPEPAEFIEDSLSPAEVMEIQIVSEPDEEAGERGHAIAIVSPDQQSLAIGRGGQNVRLAAKLTGWKIDIVSAQGGEELATADETGHVEIEAPADTPVGEDIDVLENEDATTTKEELSSDDEPTKDRDVNPDDEEFDEIDTPEEAEAELADTEDKK
ncbi:MAG: transcription termination/antitermination protein NusA [Candidatus Nomurabacteria bacterium]|nr:MAG: transcription termination/antitermination protein NusA [Candidatus Nomurabacteria bacterium]